MKIKVILTLVIGVLLLIPGIAFASNSNSVKVGSVQGEPNSSVEIPVTIENAQGVASVDFDLSYDHAVAIVTKVAKGQLLNEFSLVSNLNKASEGKVRIAMSGTTGVDGSGVLCTITLQLKGEGSSQLKIENCELGNENAETLLVNTVDGEVSIKGGSKMPPSLTPATINSTTSMPENLTFKDDSSWRSAISGITVDGIYLNSNQFTIGAGTITIAGSVFTTAGEYSIVVYAVGYNDATVNLTITQSAQDVIDYPLKSNVPSDKIWNIKFNQELDQSITPGNYISVTQSQDNVIKVAVAFGSNGKSIIVSPPLGGYNPGETYTISIAKGLVSNTGILMDKSYKMQFSVSSMSDQSPESNELIDQEFIEPNNLSATINEGFPFVAQTYTAEVSGTLMGVNINVSAFGVQNLNVPLIISIYDVYNDVPNQCLSTTKLETNKSGLIERIESYPIEQIKGSKYAIVVSYEGGLQSYGGGKGLGIWSGGSDSYLDGNMCFSIDGVNWNIDSNGDVHFRTYVIPK